MRRIAMMAAGAMVLMVLSGCGLDRECTLMGAVSGVSFDLAGAVSASATTYETRACVDDQCVDESGSRTWIFVDLPDVSTERAATARLTVRSGGAVVFEATAPLTLRKHQPNGPGCAPTVYQARVTATETGTLTAQ